MIRQLNLPTLTLSPMVYNTSDIQYQSSVINYTTWSLTDDTIAQLNSHVSVDIMENADAFYQETDSTRNCRIFTTQTRWRILYMIDPAGITLHSHDSDDNITETVNCVANSWYLIDSHIKNSSSNISGTMKALTINHLNDFNSDAHSWINAKIL